MAGKSPVVDWLTEDGLLKLKGWAREKRTDKEIAEKCIGIAERTFSDWKARYPAIVSALKEGRAPVIVEIEDSFYNLCFPQVYVDEVVETVEDKNGKVLSKHKKKTKRTVPPNVTALIFALKNLSDGRWRDRRDVNISNVVDDDTRRQVEKLFSSCAPVEETVEETDNEETDGDGENC